MRSILLLAFVLPLASSLRAQESPALDSLEHALGKATSDTARARALASLYAVSPNAAHERRLLALLDGLDRSADPAVRRSAQHARTLHLYSRGSLDMAASNYSGALHCFTEAWRLTEQSGPRDAVRHYERLQQLYEQLGDTARMGAYGLMAIPHALAAHDTSALITAMINVAVWDPQRITLDSIIRVGERFYDRGRDKDLFNWQIAYALVCQKKWREAARRLEEGIRGHGDRGATMPFALLHWTLGEMYGRMDSLALGIATTQKAIALSEAIGLQGWMGRQRNMLGEQLLRLHRDKDAEMAWLKALDELGESHQPEFEMVAARNLKDLYIREGRFVDAVRITERWILLKDSVAEMNAGKETLRLEFDNAVKADSVESAQRFLREQQLAEQRVGRERTRRNIFMFSGLGLLVFGAVVYRQRGRIQKALHRSDELLLNILPEEVANELKAKGHADAKHFDQATILFTDFKGFTEASERMSPQELVEELNTCFKAFDGIITARSIEKIKTIGDAYMCAGGLPDPKSSSPADVVQAALEMQTFMRHRKAERDAQGEPAFEMRVGIHTGPVVAGIVGVKKFAYDIWGDTVNIASRMESSGEVGEVNISEATYELVKNEPGLTFTPRGKVQAKGKGEMEMYFVGRNSERA